MNFSQGNKINSGFNNSSIGGSIPSAQHSKPFCNVKKKSRNPSRPKSRLQYFYHQSYHSTCFHGNVDKKLESPGDQLIAPANSFNKETNLKKEKSNGKYAVHPENSQSEPLPDLAAKQRNRFQTVINPKERNSRCNMKKFPDDEAPIISKDKNKTIICKHEDDSYQDVSSFEAHQRTYRSHTKIVTIPNGLRIITDILDDENINESPADSDG